MVARSVLYNQANRLVSAKTAEIGSGGIRIVSDLPLHKGHVFDFLIVLEGMGLKFKGTVVHTTSTADGRVVAGLSFDRGSSLSIRILEDYLKSHAPSFPMVDGPLDLDLSLPHSQGS
ncbi:MAG: PilZ domain-containing protein [Deltaproteobacteria bacterium]|nr:PilZ domain-containing protein [Deltaproteobacteria bacterium]MBW2122592.1 PilZ domain-containing protein [Deltaproteobacteria bacterium]